MAEALTRVALYNLVWKKPMREAAAEYGLSDRGLAKLCERNSIPVPPRGYWAQKQAGQKVQKAPLIVLAPKEPDTVILIKRAKPEPIQNNKPELPVEVRKAMEREGLPSNKINVPKTLSNLHKIIARQVAEEERRSNLFRNEKWFKPEKTNPLVARANKILSALLKGLEARGFEVDTENYNIKVSIDRDAVFINVGERIRQYRRELTVQEKADSWNSNQKYKQIREPTGKLQATIAPASSWLDKKVINEENEPLEDRLNEIVAGVIEQIWWVKRDRLRREEIERQRRDEDHRRWQRQDLLKKEQERKEKLESKAALWRKAAEIRDYVDAVEAAVHAGKIDIAPDVFSLWKDWALNHASDIDPISSGVPLIALSADEGANYT